MKVKAPAKINLTLEVLRRRANGYHTIRSVMARLPVLADVVGVRVREGEDGIRIRSNSPNVPLDDSNLCHRAASDYLRYAHRVAHIDIEIDKDIPVAAGLGGGSSDAAAVLLALNRHFNDAISLQALSAIGADIGKDLPFFISRAATAVATGMGERVRSLSKAPRLHTLLVNPRFAVSTKEAYAALAHQRGASDRRQQVNRSRIMLRAIDTADLDEIAAALHNDFEVVVERMVPVLKEVKQALVATGARGALMSGSGPTVFGVFPSKNILANGEATMRTQYPSFIVQRG
jgi:4-diphosphocytidyl-2-C-methyl-D-erythritol kinase